MSHAFTRVGFALDNHFDNKFKTVLAKGVYKDILRTFLSL